jgi:sulfhydrogenase subunit beta (sulfur reductase)
MEMIRAIIDKNRIKDLLITASDRWETYVPLEGHGADVQFEKLEDEVSLGRLNLDYERMVIPPKDICFPQLESLFEFRREKIIPTVCPQSPKLIFGLRACDLKGLLFVDDFFRRNFEDVYYLQRMEKRLTVVVVCETPSPSCFCTSAKTGPYLEDGFDLQMINLGESYLVEAGSEEGESFLKNYRSFLKEATQVEIREAEEEKQKVAEAVTLRVDFEGAIRLLGQGALPQEIYERIGERCIFCGGCLYVCPTCTCFNVFDDVRGDEGARFRNWDACVFEGYTREAGGNNPRLEKWRRTARRYEHKLKYDFLTTGLSGCVGCGRCLDSCPVDIGISKFIREITESGKMM